MIEREFALVFRGRLVRIFRAKYLPLPTTAAAIITTTTTTTSIFLRDTRFPTASRGTSLRRRSGSDFPASVASDGRKIRFRESEFAVFSFFECHRMRRLPTLSVIIVAVLNQANGVISGDVGNNRLYFARSFSG